MNVLPFRKELLATMTEKSEVGESWLFFGCRHKDKDFIFRYVCVQSFWRINYI